MLDNLEKISGIRHESYRESKSVTFDAKKIINPSDSKVTETTNIKEKPVISKNDMLLIPKANEMVFGKGNPIWDRNQMALPMAYMLHKKMPHAPGSGGYQLNTVPSSSNTDDFDILGNQPNFYDMVAKRSRQARISDDVREQYKKVYGLSEDEMHRIKPDELAQQLMEGINENLQIEDEAQRMQAEEDASVDDDDVLDAISQQDYVEDMQTVANADANNDDGTSALSKMMQETETENTDVTHAAAEQSQKVHVQSTKRYANGTISREDLVPEGYPAHTQFDAEIDIAYDNSLNDFRRDSAHFRVGDDDTLYSADGSVTYIEINSNPDSQFAKDSETLEDDESGQVTTIGGNSDGPQTEQEIAEAKYNPTDAFYKYLISLDNWDDVAGGAFDDQMFKAFQSWEETEGD